MADKEKRDWRMYYNENKEKASKARMKYAKTHETQIKFVLNNENDRDIIEHLNKEKNKSGYLKQLIRDDIARREKEINELLYGTPEPPVQKVPTAPAQDDGMLYSNTPDDDT